MTLARDSIFISYRREDCAHPAGRLAAALKGHFGERRVFFDTEAITPGEQFPVRIGEELARARIVLVLVGQAWLRANYANGKRRIDDLDDWVHLEVATALGSQG